MDKKDMTPEQRAIANRLFDAFSKHPGRLDDLVKRLESEDLVSHEEAFGDDINNDDDEFGAQGGSPHVPKP